MSSELRWVIINLSVKPFFPIINCVDPGLNQKFLLVFRICLIWLLLVFFMDPEHDDTLYLTNHTIPNLKRKFSVFSV